MPHVPAFFTLAVIATMFVFFVREVFPPEVTAMAGAAILLPQWVAHPFFDSRWTNWVGLVTHKPVTEDFVPLLPWLGVMWWGAAAGQWLLAHRRGWLAGAVARPLAPLAALGRWPLSFYMLHQPLLIGAIVACTTMTR